MPVKVFQLEVLFLFLAGWGDGLFPFLSLVGNRNESIVIRAVGSEGSSPLNLVVKTWLEAQVSINVWPQH